MGVAWIGPFALCLMKEATTMRVPMVLSMVLSNLEGCAILEMNIKQLYTTEQTCCTVPVEEEKTSNCACPLRISLCVGRGEDDVRRERCSIGQYNSSLVEVPSQLNLSIDCPWRLTGRDSFLRTRIYQYDGSILIDHNMNITRLNGVDGPLHAVMGLCEHKEAECRTRAVAEVQVGLRCARNQYGPECLARCMPPLRGYHYTCEKTTGRIRCSPGWTGRFCDTPVCASCQHGKCTYPNKCACSRSWSGRDCSNCVPSPGCVNGHCVDGGDCVCFPGWGGVNCDRYIGCIGGQCNAKLPYTFGIPKMCNTTCSGHGHCGLTAGEGLRCICDTGYEGVQCEEQNSGGGIALLIVSLAILILVLIAFLLYRFKSKKDVINEVIGDEGSEASEYQERIRGAHTKRTNCPRGDEKIEMDQRRGPYSPPPTYEQVMGEIA